MAFAPFPVVRYFSRTRVINQKTFEYLLPAACAWARAQEKFVLERGVPLDPRQIEDARRVGVQDSSQVRLLVVDRIPLPDDPQLAEAARHGQIITDASRAVTIGHGIIIRADSWGDRELILHQLVHIAQCERSGGLDGFVEKYLCERRTCAKFTIGALEEEARGLAHEICAADKAF
jgi:hypothetical protein